MVSAVKLRGPEQPDEEERKNRKLYLGVNFSKADRKGLQRHTGFNGGQFPKWGNEGDEETCAT